MVKTQLVLRNDKFATKTVESRSDSSWVNKHETMKTRLCMLYDLTIAHPNSFGQRYFSSGNRYPGANGPLGACHSSLSVCPRRLRIPSGLASLSSDVSFRQIQTRSEGEDGQHQQKRKTARAPAAKTSLRKVAIEAQRSRDLSVEKSTAQDGHIATKVTGSPMRSGYRVFS